MRSSSVQAESATQAGSQAPPQQRVGEMDITGGFASPQDKPPIATGWKDRIAGIFGKSTPARDMSTPLLDGRDDLKDAELRIALQKDTKHDGLSPLNDPDSQGDYRPPSPSMVKGEAPGTAATASTTTSSTMTSLSTISTTTSSAPSSTTTTTTSTPAAVTTGKASGDRFSSAKINGHTVRVLGREGDHVVFDISPEGFKRLEADGAKPVSVGSRERRRIGGLDGGRTDFVRCRLPADSLEMWAPRDSSGRTAAVDSKALPEWDKGLVLERQKARVALGRLLLAENGGRSRLATADDFVGKKKGDRTFVLSHVFPRGYILRHETAVESAESPIKCAFKGAHGYVPACRSFYDLSSGSLKAGGLYTTPFKDVYAMGSLANPSNHSAVKAIIELPSEAFWDEHEETLSMVQPAWEPRD